MVGCIGGPSFDLSMIFGHVGPQHLHPMHNAMISPEHSAGTSNDSSEERSNSDAGDRQTERRSRSRGGGSRRSRRRHRRRSRRRRSRSRSRSGGKNSRSRRSRRSRSRSGKRPSRGRSSRGETRSRKRKSREKSRIHRGSERRRSRRRRDSRSRSRSRRARHRPLRKRRGRRPENSDSESTWSSDDGSEGSDDSSSESESPPPAPESPPGPLATDPQDLNLGSASEEEKEREEEEEEISSDWNSEHEDGEGKEGGEARDFSSDEEKAGAHLSDVEISHPDDDLELTAEHHELTALTGDEDDFVDAMGSLQLGEEAPAEEPRMTELMLMQSLWYYRDPGTGLGRGPEAFQDIKLAWDRSVVDEETLVWSPDSGSDRWSEMWEVPGLVELLSRDISELYPSKSESGAEASGAQPTMLRPEPLDTARDILAGSESVNFELASDTKLHPGLTRLSLIKVSHLLHAACVLCLVHPCNVHSFCCWIQKTSFGSLVAQDSDDRAHPPQYQGRSRSLLPLHSQLCLQGPC